MEKISTVQASGRSIFHADKLTIELDLGDRFSFYCVLDEGKILLEQKLPSTPEAMQRIFERMAPCRIAMETGTHSPW